MDKKEEQNNQIATVPAHGEISQIFGLAAKTADLEGKLSKEVLKNADKSVEAVNIQHATEPARAVDEAETDAELIHEVEQYNSHNLGLSRAAKFILPYLAVFGVGIFLYYFYFSDFSFNQILKPKTEVAGVSKQKNVDELYKQEAKNYATWVSQYFFEVSDSSVTDRNADLSGNGLNNFDKYILGLNPKVYDSLGTGEADSQVLSDGKDPLTGKDLTDDQKKLIEQYIDLDVALNKKTAPKNIPVQATVPAGLGLPQTIYTSTGVTTSEPGMYDIRGAEFNSTNSTTTNNNGTQPSSSVTPRVTYAVANTSTRTNPVATTSRVNNSSSNQTAATTQITYNKFNLPATANYMKIDLSKPGRLKVPYLNIDVPVIWSKSNSDFDSDLEKGVIHLPQTALPGSLGRAYISGHSSGFIWSKGDYNNIFARLAELPENSSFSIVVTNTSGKTITLKYVIYKRGQFAPDDQAQFASGPESEVALGTCWPVGGTKLREVLIGRLDKIE